MGTEIAYTPGQVTRALRQLALDFGDVETTSERLIDDEFQVSALTLLEWKLDLHAEQYQRIAEQLGLERERNAIGQLQEIVVRANELKLPMMERVGEITRAELVPQALRALSDAGAKATAQLMQLTGRPLDGKAGDASVDSMIRLVTGLQGAGLLNIAPPVAEAIEADAKDVITVTD